jgi:hypothetical protein
MKKKINFIALLFVIIVAGTIRSANGQTPTYNLYLTNISQPSSYELEFDVFILRTGSTVLELNSATIGVMFDTSITWLNNASTPGVPHHSFIVPSIVPGTSELNPICQPTSVLYNSVGTLPSNLNWAGAHCFRVMPYTGSTSIGTIISNVNGGCSHPGTRIARFKMRNQVSSTNTTPVDFNSSVCNMKFTTVAGTNINNTIIVKTGGGIGSVITNSANHYSYNSPNTCCTNNPLNPFPIITGFSTNIINGGIGSTLTINGSNFGASRGTIGNLIFKNANDGGLTEVTLDNSDWTGSTWTNTQITVKLPSVVTGGTPGSGIVKVRNLYNKVGSSSVPIDIKYSISSFGVNKATPRIGNWKCDKKTFYLGNGFTPTPLQQTAITAACIEWSNKLGIPITLNTTNPQAPWNLQDGYSTIFINDNLTEKIKSTRHTNICQNEIFLTETDIEIRNSGVNWHTTLFDNVIAGNTDFYYAILHEIGRSLGLENVIDLTNGSKEIMQATIPVGPIFGTDRTSLTTGGGDAWKADSLHVIAPSLNLSLNYNFCADISPLLTFSTSSVTINASGTNVCANNPVTLTCSAPNSNGNLFLWSTGSTLNAITVTTPGVYTVSVTNSNCTRTSQPITINAIANSSTVTLHPVNSSTCAGGSATFTAAGPAGSTYQWQRSIANGVWTDLSNGSYYSNVTGSTLTVNNAQFYSGSLQQYRCMVRQNQYCSQPSNPATLTVVTVEMGPLSSVYSNAAAFTLTTGSPSGGTYSGTGVSGNTFNPSVAGVGFHLITYTKSGCSPVSASQYIQVVACCANNITTNNIPNSICLVDPQTPLSISFTALGTYNSGNIFTAQISNSSGSFAGSPTSIGTINSTTSGTINALLPIGLADGTGYKIRVIASSPGTTGTANQFPMTILHYPCFEPKLSFVSVESENQAVFEVHPNPAQSRVTLTLPSDKKAYTASITDLNGKLVFINQVSNMPNYEIDISNLQAGAYVVKIISTDDLYYKKLIISK